jgi:hypothetical protein
MSGDAHVVRGQAPPAAPRQDPLSAVLHRVAMSLPKDATTADVVRAIMEVAPSVGVSADIERVLAFAERLRTELCRDAA